MSRWFVLLLAICSPVSASAVEASDGSIEELLAVTKTEQSVDSTFAFVERRLQLAMQQYIAGKTVSAAQRRVLDERVASVMQTIRAQFTWQTVKPMYIQAYRETFDQAEVDGIVAFYKSAAGQAYTTKQPLLSEKVNTSMQARLEQLMPQILQALRTALAEAGVQ